VGLSLSGLICKSLPQRRRGGGLGEQENEVEDRERRQACAERACPQVYIQRRVCLCIQKETKQPLFAVGREFVTCSLYSLVFAHIKGAEHHDLFWI
jgi:hypothetical protein